MTIGFSTSQFCKAGGMGSGNQGPDRESDWPGVTKNKQTPLVSQSLQPDLGASVVLNCLKETRQGQVIIPVWPQKKQTQRVKALPKGSLQATGEERHRGLPGGGASIWAGRSRGRQSRQALFRGMASLLMANFFKLK